MGFTQPFDQFAGLSYRQLFGERYNPGLRNFRIIQDFLPVLSGNRLRDEL